MTDLDDDHQPIDELTRWRYWIVPHNLVRPSTVKLQPGDHKDKNVWTRDGATAVCRRDPTHKPPHPDCSCGLYAINGANIQAAVGLRQFQWDAIVQHAWREMHGYTTSLTHPPTLASPDMQLEIVKDWWARTREPRHDGVYIGRLWHPGNLFVVGQVRMRNVLPIHWGTVLYVAGRIRDD